jgi:hypothetical protein
MRSASQVRLFGGTRQLANFRDRHKGAQLAKLHEAGVRHFWCIAPSGASPIGWRDALHRNMRLDAHAVLDYRLNLASKRSST